MAGAQVRGAALAAACRILAAFLFVAPATVNAVAPLIGASRPEPLFEKNIGQDSSDVLFRSRLGGIEARVKADGTLVIVPQGRPLAGGITIAARGAQSGPSIEAEEASAFHTNYFRGGEHPGKFVDVPHFGRVLVRGVYAGIDLDYHASEGKLEFDFVVAPGSDPARIVIGIDGATSVRLGDSGDLTIERDGETLLQRRPRAYQWKEGHQVEVRSAYRLTAPNEISVDVGTFDPAAELVIDPVVEYASFLGGSNNDEPAAAAIGSDGYLYVTGLTFSSNFPTVGALDSTEGGAYDLFITKINPANGKIVYSTYLGGGGADNANAIAVDAAGSVYVTGHAESRFPTTSGAYETASISQGGFVAKLAPAGNALVYSTYIYGTTPRAIAVDAQGRAAVTGAAGTGFIPSAGALRTTTAAGTAISGDAFALLLNSSGNAAVFATFLNALAGGVAIDSAGRVVVAGGAAPGSGLPLVNPIDTTSAAFLAAFALDGKSLVYSTRLPVPPPSYMVMDPYDNVAMVDGAQTLSKVSTSPLSIRFSTHVGSSASCCQTLHGVATDALGDIYVFGHIRLQQTSDISYFQPVHPVVANSYLLSKASGPYYFFASGYSRDGQTLRFQTLLGGSAGSGFNTDTAGNGGGLAAHGVGEAFVAGITSSNSWTPIAAVNTQPAATIPNPSVDPEEVFLMTLGMEPEPLEISATNPNPVASTPVTLVATSYVAGASGVVTFYDRGTSIGSASTVEGIAKLDAALPAGVHRITASLGATQSALLVLPVVLPSAQ